MATTMNGSVTPDEIDATAELIRMYLVGQGAASKDEIRAFCAEQGIATALYQKAFVRLDRQLNLVTETVKEGGLKAWEVKDLARRFTLREILELTVTVSGTTKKEKYDKYYQVSGRFRLLSPCLSSVPTEDPSKVEFLRDDQGRVLFLSGYFKSMFKHASEKPGFPEIGNARFRIFWTQQAIDPALVVPHRSPVPPERMGLQGRGICIHESLPANVEIPFECSAPLSHVSAEQLGEALVVAGKWSGFSPAKAHLGFGRFEVLL